MSLRSRLIAPVILGVLAAACTAATAENASTTTVFAVDSPAQQTALDDAAMLAQVAPTTEPVSSTTTPSTVAAPSTSAMTTTTLSPFARPEWLGTRVLDERPDGFGIVQPTPPELIDRRFATPELLPPPTGADFASTVGPIPAAVAARSSWRQGCPLGLEELAYITVSHVGFDGEPHTGEMIVNARVAEAVVGVFAELYAAGFPIEEMRVTRADEIDAPPTGDRNVTGSFACREAVNSGNWSQHAYGLAIDINPFHNPYIKGDLVIPELASYYVDRELLLPGMVETSVVVREFRGIGWTWGGDWNSLKDWMHFSESGT